MYVNIECASEKLFMKNYSSIIESLDEQKIQYRFIRDEIGFGDISIQDGIVIGLVFVFETIRSGLTYDVLKVMITQTLRKLPKDDIKNVYVSVRDKKSGDEYEIDLQYSDHVDLEMPGKLKLKIDTD